MNTQHKIKQSFIKIKIALTNNFPLPKKDVQCGDFDDVDC